MADHESNDQLSDLTGRILTASLRPETTAFVAAELESLLPGARHGEVLLLSESPPAWIEISLRYGLWVVVLKSIWDATGKPFLTKLSERLGERYADDLYDSLRRLMLVGKHPSKAASITKILARAQEIEGRAIQLRLSITFEERRNVVRCPIPCDSPEDAEVGLYYFALILPGLSSALNAIWEEGHDPRGPLQLRPTPHGYYIEWFNRDQTSLSRAEFTFDGERSA